MSLYELVVTTTTIEPCVVASVEATGVMIAHIAAMMSNIMGMPMMLRAIATFGNLEIERGFYIFRTHLVNRAPVGTKTEPCRPDSY